MHLVIELFYLVSNLVTVISASHKFSSSQEYLTLNRFLPTAREGSVYDGVRHSVHNWRDGYSVTAHPCYASYWNAFLFYNKLSLH